MGWKERRKLERAATGRPPIPLYRRFPNRLGRAT
jgi:hypothetical protein